MSINYTEYNGKPALGIQSYFKAFGKCCGIEYYGSAMPDDSVLCHSSTSLSSLLLSRPMQTS